MSIQVLAATEVSRRTADFASPYRRKLDGTDAEAVRCDNVRQGCGGEEDDLEARFSRESSVMNCRSPRNVGNKTGEDMRREIKSSTELQAVCLQTLKQCPGFERVDEIVIQPRPPIEGGANWTLAAVRPRVCNDVLRGARQTIDDLRQSYELDEAAAAAMARAR